MKDTIQITKVTPSAGAVMLEAEATFEVAGAVVTREMRMAVNPEVFKRDDPEGELIAVLFKNLEVIKDVDKSCGWLKAGMTYKRDKKGE